MRRVTFSDSAINDLSAILEYLEQYSPSYAEKLAEDIDRRTEQLALLPRLGRARDDLIAGLRSVAIDQYLVFYTFNDTEVSVIRIFHGARNYAEELRLK